MLDIVCASYANANASASNSDSVGSNAGVSVGASVGGSADKSPTPLTSWSRESILPGRSCSAPVGVVVTVTVWPAQSPTLQRACSDGGQENQGPRPVGPDWAEGQKKKEKRKKEKRSPADMTARVRPCATRKVSGMGAAPRADRGGRPRGVPPTGVTAIWVPGVGDEPPALSSFDAPRLVAPWLAVCAPACSPRLPSCRPCRRSPQFSSRLS